LLVDHSSSRLPDPQVGAFGSSCCSLGIHRRTDEPTELDL
jgi:hypothetical protein